MLRRYRKFLLVLWFCGLVFLYLLNRFSIPAMSLLYWVIFGGWFVFSVIFNKKSSFTLMLAFTLYCFSAVLYVLGFINFSEGVMRVSFIGWIIGLSIALVEYKRRLKPEKNTKDAKI